MKKHSADKSFPVADFREDDAIIKSSSKIGSFELGELLSFLVILHPPEKTFSGS